MRLTNLHRQAFVKAALQDVPQIDYDEQIHKLIVEDAINQLPVAIQRVAQDNQLKGWLKTVNYYPVVGLGIALFSQDRWNHNYTPSKKVQVELQSLLQKRKEQRETLRQLEEKLHGVAKSVTTRKALAELLPEFEKYLPTEQAPVSKSVPAISNMVGDFIRAGWPKDQPKKTAKPTKAKAPAASNADAVIVL